MLIGGARVEVVLEAPARAVAPGQCAVFYSSTDGVERGREVTGGGWIADITSGVLRSRR